MHVAIKYLTSILTTSYDRYLSFWSLGIAFSEVPSQQQGLRLSTLDPFSVVQLVNCISSAR